MTPSGPKVIAHRGASNDAPENSQTAIQKATELNIYAIEFDIRLTSGGQFIISHDASFKRTAGIRGKISKNSLKWLTKNVTLKDGLPPPSLKDALKYRKNKHVFIEAKAKNWSVQLNEFARNNNFSNVSVLSFNYDELAKFHALQLNIPCFSLTFWRPLHCLKIARSYGFYGIGTHWMAINPIVVWLARRWKIELMVYTVNFSVIAKIINAIYPSVTIATNKPKELIDLLTK
ncbi:MAG: glycerophosphodiester phosphodiesterase family protein [Patescibacteria group bacterium]